MARSTKYISAISWRKIIGMRKATTLDLRESREENMHSSWR
jgi:hypothetical protein